jgi:hypothetical protein
MRFSRQHAIILTITALIALGIVGVAGAKLLQPTRPLLTDANFSLSTITPNADGVEDATTIRYTVNRNASVTIALANKADSTRYVFRDAEMRPMGSYSVDFSGVVDGFSLPNEDLGGDIETRLIPNGDYTWTIDAVTESGETAQSSGTLTVKDADSALPIIQSFTVSPESFTPNQDGIDDRVSINAYLAKAADLTVYLENKALKRYYLAERMEGRKPGEPGAHFFDYDGGVDNNITPPPDGDYTLVAVVQDKTGQRIRRTSHLTIKDGGLPNAEIVPQASGRQVSYITAPYKDEYLTTLEKTGTPIPMPDGVTSTQAQMSMMQGDLLIFRLTISNYGSTPIRTTGPWPGTVYHYEQNSEALFTSSKSGVWHVGIMCERAETNYPWRWAIGSQDQLTKVDRDGETLWYLMPGKSAVVWGAVRMTKIIKTRNPQDCYAGLIHEDVAIPPLQANVSPIKVLLTANEPDNGTVSSK